MRFQDSEGFKKDGGDESFRGGGMNILANTKMKKKVQIIQFEICL